MSSFLYFDCLSGISGDMTLGGLVDLGVDVRRIESAVRSMGLPDVSITAHEVRKKGFRATKVDVGHPPEHAHRHLHTIAEMIDRGDEIESAAKDLAKRIFTVVAEAEARVHGTSIEKVHFHEVGAIDSIADIVGTAVAMTELGVKSVQSSPVPTGHGEVTIAHGRVSIPAPATAEILSDIPIAASPVQGELTTPTGAAILKAMATRFGPPPSMVIEAVGYGAGTKDWDQQANVLRVYRGRLTESSAVMSDEIEQDEVVVLETNLDDSTPEQIAFAVQQLTEAGVIDVFETACSMKKGRQGIQLTVLAKPADADALERMLFLHTSTIGVRRHIAQRNKLRRREITVETEYGPIAGKIVELPGGKQRFTVEHEAAAEAARRHSVSLAEVTEAAIVAVGSANVR